MTSINFWPILISAVVAFGVGALWYSPVLFGKEWMRLKNISEKDITDEAKKGMWKLYVTQFVMMLVTFTVLGFFMAASGSRSLGDGLFFAFLAWIGFSLTSGITDTLWNRTPVKLVLITEVCVLVTWLIGGAIIAAWR